MARTMNAVIIDAHGTLTRNNDKAVNIVVKNGNEVLSTKLSLADRPDRNGANIKARTVEKICKYGLGKKASYDLVKKAIADKTLVGTPVTVVSRDVPREDGRGLMTSHSVYFANEPIGSAAVVSL